MRLRQECLPLLVAWLALTLAIKVPPGVLEKLKNLSLDEVKCQPDGPGSDISVAVGDTFRMKKSGEIYECICGLPFCEKLKKTVADVAACCKKTDGTCVKHGNTWYDEKTCDNLKCESKGTKPKPKTITKGCVLKSGKCLRHGQHGREDCNDVKCDDGELKITGPGCKQSDGQCVKSGASWTDKDCANFQCVRKKDAAEIKDISTGCKDTNGKCLEDGDTIVAGCVTSLCEKGKLTPTKHGCPKSGGGCYKSGQVVEDDCSKKECVDGKMVVSLSGCKKTDGSCAKVGDTWNDSETCDKLECQKNGETDTTVKRIGSGCKNANGKCVPGGHTWFDLSTCTEFACRKQGDETARVIVGEGCKNKAGVCIKHGEEAMDGCSTHHCVNGKLKTKKSGCEKKGGGCYANGEKFSEKCSKKKCVDGEIIVKKVGCEKKDGGCYKEGETYNEKCSKMKCLDGKNKIIEGGCESKGGGKTCLKEGETVRSNKKCRTMECVKEGNDYVLKHVSSDCVIDAGYCIRKFHVLIDQKTCKEFQCKPKGKLDVSLVEVGRGCSDGKGGCVRHSSVKNFECSTSTCINGKMKVIKAGCEKKDGTCAADQEEYTEKGEKCTKYVCRNGKTKKVKQDCVNHMNNDMCLGVGKEYSNKKDCDTYECKKQGDKYKMVLKTVGCRSRTGECVARTESWEDKKKCEAFKCMRVDGKLKMVLTRQDCISVYDKCFKAGSKEQFTCEVDGYEYHRCDCLKGSAPYPGIGKKKPYPGHPHTISREGPIKQEGVCKFPFEWNGRKFGSCTMRGWPRLWCGTERPFKTKHWGQCLPEADVATKQGNKCHFPFKYKGEWQHECIRAKSPWCSLTENYDEDQQKAECIQTPLQLNGFKPVNNQLIKQGQCVFPFKYKGKIYRDCVRSTWKRPWCSLDYDHDKSKRWGYCVTWKMWRVWSDYKP